MFSPLFSLISVPPERISIRDESNTERNSVVGPYGEGDSMRLKCDVYGGRPKPNITWYRDGYEIASEAYLVPSGRHQRSDIVVERLSRQDLNSRFSCKAINHHRATPVEASVQLDMNCECYVLGFSAVPFIHINISSRTESIEFFDLTLSIPSVQQTRLRDSLHQ